MQRVKPVIDWRDDEFEARLLDLVAEGELGASRLKETIDLDGPASALLLEGHRSIVREEKARLAQSSIEWQSEQGASFKDAVIWRTKAARDRLLGGDMEPSEGAGQFGRVIVDSQRTAMLSWVGEFWTICVPEED